MSMLKIKYDGKKKTVDRSAYAKAKTKQLREFGYPDLKVEDVETQITALLEKKEFGKGLTVIGGFMEGEVLDEL